MTFSAAMHLGAKGVQYKGRCGRIKRTCKPAWTTDVLWISNIPMVTSPVAIAIRRLRRLTLF